MIRQCEVFNKTEFMFVLGRQEDYISQNPLQLDGRHPVQWNVVDTRYDIKSSALGRLGGSMG